MRGTTGVRRAAVLAVLMVAASGCGVLDDMTTSDFAKQGAGDIVDAAVEATGKVESVRVTGPFMKNGREYFMDLWVSSSGDCKGSLRLSGNNMDLRRVDGTTWFKGESGFFNMATYGSDVPTSALKKISTHWVAFDKDDKAVKKFCDLDTMFKGIKTLKVKEGERAVRGDEEDLDGVRAVKLTYNAGGAHAERVWVASESPHYVVKVSSDESRDAATLVYSGFNEKFTVDKPAAKEVFTP